MPAVTYRIRARRWFNKRVGNTYYSVYVWKRENGNTAYVGGCDYDLGYGDQYLQTAHKILQEAGEYPKTGVLINGMDADYEDFYWDKTDHPEKFDIEVSDVPRKRDLKPQ